jgi:pentatricopeptide repeat protein
MEYEGCLTSTSVSFNILFDIAIKAGQFEVADRIVKEMESRGLDFSRCGRVSRIFFYGLQRNADGVRQAYHDFVKAGEIVDTVVLNCIMASLIRAGEFEVAEQMYERMKDVHQNAPKYLTGEGPLSAYPSPSDNYVAYRKASKKLGRVLGVTAFLHDKLPDHHRALQAVLPLTPDAKTFYIFLSYHALVSGNLVRVMALLDDMEATFSIPPQGMIYMFLLQGFSIHGGKSRTMWTFSQLKGVWASFLRAMHDSKAEVETKQRTKHRKAKLVWENPLKRPGYDYATETAMGCSAETTNRTALLDKEMGTNLNGLNEDASPSSFADPDWGDEPDDDWKYENGVYLGRRLIISCLRAFSVCGGPEAVIEVWTQIDRLWRSESQKMADIIAVKIVLDRLLRNIAER